MDRCLVSFFLLVIFNLFYALKVSICGTRRFQTVLALVGLEFLMYFFKLILFTPLILKLNQLLHIVVLIKVLNAELVILRQVLCGYELLMGGLDHHLGLEVDFSAALLLTLIDELALIFVLGQASIPEPRIHQLLLDGVFLFFNV